MAALPASNTCRLFVDYVTRATSGTEHTCVLRYTGSDRTGTAAQNRFLSLLTAMGAGSFGNGWKVIRVRTALAGETFTLTQVPVSGLASFLGTASASTDPRTETIQCSFVGRSLTSPRKVALFLYGFSSSLVSAQLRTTTSGATPAVWGPAVQALNAASSPLVAIDGTAVSWYNYVNFSQNSYWERRKRIG